MVILVGTSPDFVDFKKATLAEKLVKEVVIIFLSKVDMVSNKTKKVNSRVIMSEKVTSQAPLLAPEDLDLSFFLAIMENPGPGI